MENNTVVNRKEIDKIIKTVTYAKKPSLVVLRIGIFIMAILAMFDVMTMHSNSVFSSSLRFSFVFLTTSLFLMIFNSYANKASIVGGLCALNNLIDKMSRNEWGYPFPTKNIHPLILLHPVFRVIAGLYICKAGSNDDGLLLIDKAVIEMPEICDSVSQGQIINIVKFRALTDVAINELSPGKTFVAVFKLILALYPLLIFIYAIELIFALFTHFYSK